MKKTPAAKARTQATFLKAYVARGSITEAAEAAGINRASHYDWLQADPAYRERWDACQEEAAQALEDEAIRRAFKGSDVLLIFLLKGLRPDKYRERYEVKSKSKVKFDRPKVVQYLDELLTTDQLKQLRDRMLAEQSTNKTVH